MTPVHHLTLAQSYFTNQPGPLFVLPRANTVAPAYDIVCNARARSLTFLHADALGSSTMHEVAQGCCGLIQAIQPEGPVDLVTWSDEREDFGALCVQLLGQSNRCVRQIYSAERRNRSIELPEHPSFRIIFESKKEPQITKKPSFREILLQLRDPKNAGLVELLGKELATREGEELFNAQSALVDELGLWLTQCKTKRDIDERFYCLKFLQVEALSLNTRTTLINVLKEVCCYEDCASFFCYTQYTVVAVRYAFNLLAQIDLDTCKICLEYAAYNLTDNTGLTNVSYLADFLALYRLIDVDGFSRVDVKVIFARFVEYLIYDIGRDPSLAAKLADSPFAVSQCTEYLMQKSTLKSSHPFIRLISYITAEDNGPFYDVCIHWILNFYDPNTGPLQIFQRLVNSPNSGISEAIHTVVRRQFDEPQTVSLDFVMLRVSALRNKNHVTIGCSSKESSAAWQVALADAAPFGKWSRKELLEQSLTLGVQVIVYKTGALQLDNFINGPLTERDAWAFWSALKFLQENGAHGERNLFQEVQDKLGPQHPLSCFLSYVQQATQAANIDEFGRVATTIRRMLTRLQEAGIGFASFTTAYKTSTYRFEANGTIISMN